MGEFFRISPSTTGLRCPLVESCEITLICLHSPPPKKRKKRLFLFKRRTARGQFCETHDLRRGKKKTTLNPAGNMTELTGKLGLKPFFQQIAGPTVSTKLCVSLLHHCRLSAHPAGVFNGNLSLQECPSSASVISFLPSGT